MISVLIAAIWNALIVWAFTVLIYFKGYLYFDHGCWVVSNHQMYLAGVFAVFITSLIALIFSTGAADVIFGAIMSIRRPIPRENERLRHLLDEVNNEVCNKYNFKKIKVVLRIKDSQSYNMMAIGIRTISINRFLYETYPDKTIKAVLAHELGHIYYRDSVNIGISAALVVCGALGLIASFLAAVITWAFAKNMTARSGIGGVVGLLALIITALAGIIFIILISAYFFFNIVLRFAYRKMEYRADKFACELGYGKELMTFFEDIKDIDYEQKGIWKLLFSTHPKTIQRIGKIEKMEIAEKVSGV